MPPDVDDVPVLLVPLLLLLPDPVVLVVASLTAVLRLLELVVLETPPLLTGELAPQDVVPPNISFEDY